MAISSSEILAIAFTAGLTAACSHFGRRYHGTMRIVAISTLRDFWERHPTAQPAISAWLALARKAAWNTPQDAVAMWSRTSVLPNNRLVFRLANDWRLIVEVFYPARIMFVKFIGTHAEYDKIDAATVDDY